MGAMPTTPPAAAVYARISEDREGGGLGVERQENDCRELAERLGVRVVAVHVDNDISAYSGKPRPGYDALVKSIEAGDIGVVLAWHSDRLHRRTSELERYITACEKHGVATHTVRAGLLDLSTPGGRMNAKILGAVAQQESEHKGERVSAARKQRVLAGKFAGGPRPFGFEADGITIRPSEAAEIVKATDALLAGAGLRGCVLDLNRRKVPTALGAPAWQSRTLKDVLLRPRNAGLNVYQGEIVGPAVWEPIIPEPRWRALVALLTDKGRRTAPSDLGTKGKVRWLGSGLYRCGVCGLPELRVSNNSRGTPTYRCRSRHWTPGGTGHVSRSARVLDELVEALIVERLSRADALELLVPPPPDVDTDALNAEVVALTSQMGQLADAYAEQQVTLAQLTRATDRMQKRLSEVQRELTSAVRGDPLAGLIGKDVDVAAAWRRLDLGRQRSVLDALMTVTVMPTGPTGSRFDPTSVQITWKTS
jgi:site-specific DNA recombinase